MEVDLTELYGKIAGPWVSTLLGELLILGFFFVIYNYIRLIVNKSIPLNGKDIFRRCILLGAVSLFVFYVDLVYFIEYQNVEFSGMINRLGNLSESEIQQSKIILVSIVPIDLLIIAVLTGMFATLSIEVFYEKKTPAGVASLTRIIIWLFFFASCYHLLSAIWWLAGSVLASTGLPLNDILYHVVYFSLHFAGYFICNFFLRKDSHNNYAIICFVSLLLSVYVVRQWWYIDKILA